MLSSPSSRYLRRLNAFSRIEELDNRNRQIQRLRTIKENYRQTSSSLRLRRIREEQGALHVDRLNDDDCLALFRFTYDQMREMIIAFGLDENITIRPESERYHYKVSAIEALAIMLNRLSFPARLRQLQLVFGRHRTELSRIFNLMINLLYNKYAKALELDRRQFCLTNLRRFSSAIHEAGSPYPNCVGFIDGTFMRCARPVRDEFQQILYNGHYRGHGFKFQAIVTPDGITSSLWGPITGNRHDAQMYEESNMENHIEPLFDMRKCNGRHYHLYGDAAYANSNVIQRPFSRVTANAHQLEQNKLMSSVRIAVENEFAHTTNLFAFLDFSRTLRSGQSTITKYYIVATFLKNVHVCLNNGNQTSTRFRVLPPTLHTYLDGLS